MIREIRPQGDILRALKGATEKYPLKEKLEPDSNMPDEVSLVKEGSGIIGLREVHENKEWSSLFNHFVKTARVATYLAERLRAVGVKVDPKQVLNSMLVSHVGRRQWEEARRYPEQIKDAEKKVKSGETAINVALLMDVGVSSVIINNIAAHGTRNPKVDLDTWEKKLGLYADFRVAQNLMTLEERFNGMHKAVEIGKITKEELSKLKEWARSVEFEIFNNFIDPKNGVLLEPGDLNDDFPKQPAWEKYLRRLYIQDAEVGIYQKLDDFERRIMEANSDEEVEKIAQEVSKQFPENTWWGRYIRDMYVRQGEKPNLQTDQFGVIGTERAIAFFQSLDLGRIYEDDMYKRFE
ncbi:MAG: hypothetical protein HY979_02895 [Candidatus Magasanikbacteria bacterium]|nr:hypothetical protein [Candidatus Magasanikbacteria bacterium]